VLASGLSVELVGNDVLAWGIGLLWLVGITNAFNLLDNMDGLAATLAAIACGYFAIDAVTEHENETVLVLSLALGVACAGFLPFNLRPGRSAHVFMGDSGSQVLGFGLASLALASSWTVAGTTTATILLPLLILAIPILDTTLVTLKRLAERRPVTQGGRDHTSHRLVYYGLSEAKAVLLLALVAAAIGATALAYNVLDNGRLTAVGVLLTFVLLVQFGSFLSDLEERSRSGVTEGPEPSLWRALVFEPRRLVEVVVDFLVICGSFLAAYLLVVGGTGTEYERSVFLSALPILLATRYVFFVALGVYRRVWRFATARDVLAIAAGCVASAIVAYAVLVALRPIGSFPAVEIFVVDAVLATLLVGASRLTLRLLPELQGHRLHRRRVLVVGAGAAGRGLARELRESHEARVVGFLDDNPRVRRRRILGISVVGSLDEADRAIAGTRADEVLVTIPAAAQERLDAVVRASETAGIPCRIVHRRTEFSAPETVEASLT
jgi:UDP-GlcNAc:undecaprenyl-phosphate GlcNAc-1-phosphate transferase